MKKLSSIFILALITDIYHWHQLSTYTSSIDFTIVLNNSWQQIKAHITNSTNLPLARTFAGNSNRFGFELESTTLNVTTVSIVSLSPGPAMLTGAGIGFI